MVLSDGAGGHAGGSLAAEVTVDAVVSLLSSSKEPFGALLLEEAVRRANEAVRSRREADLTVSGMAATLTVGIVTSVVDDALEWLVTSIGDSRAWLVTREGSVQLTEDDNVAAQLLKEGAITQTEALAHPGRHWITRAIGTEDRVVPGVMPVRLKRGDALLLSSDGLDVLGPTAIHQVIRATSGSKDAAEQLVERALESGATDNVTAAVARHLDATCHRLGDEPAC
jgi:protein phosphatase